MGPIKQVVFEYEDGTVEVLEGEHLKKWLEFNRMTGQMAYAAGMNPPWKEIKWRKVSKEEVYY